MPVNEQIIKNLTELGERFDSLIKQLEAEDKAESEKSDERWKPKMMETYWICNLDGCILGYCWSGSLTDIGLYNSGNCFKTQKEAELHKLRLESMANRWKPDYDEEFYYFTATGTKIYWNNYLHNAHFSDYWIGNCHKTEEDAQKWYEKYGEAFGI